MCMAQLSCVGRRSGHDTLESVSHVVSKWPPLGPFEDECSSSGGNLKDPIDVVLLLNISFDVKVQ
jgi:hypothetical protein